VSAFRALGARLGNATAGAVLIADDHAADGRWRSCHHPRSRRTSLRAALLALTFGTGRSPAHAASLPANRSGPRSVRPSVPQQVRDGLVADGPLKAEYLMMRETGAAPRRGDRRPSRCPCLSEMRLDRSGRLDCGSLLLGFVRAGRCHRHVRRRAAGEGPGGISWPSQHKLGGTQGPAGSESWICIKNCPSGQRDVRITEERDGTDRFDREGRTHGGCLCPSAPNGRMFAR
jgi:hypothetical protein